MQWRGEVGICCNSWSAGDGVAHGGRASPAEAPVPAARLAAGARLAARSGRSPEAYRPSGALNQEAALADVTLPGSGQQMAASLLSRRTVSDGRGRAIRHGVAGLARTTAAGTTAGRTPQACKCRSLQRIGHRDGEFNG